MYTTVKSMTIPILNQFIKIPASSNWYPLDVSQHQNDLKWTEDEKQIAEQ